MKNQEEFDSTYSKSEINPNAPFLPDGASIGKGSMIFAVSNDVLKALPLDTVSSGARSFFDYLTMHAADEIRKAVELGTYDYSDTKVKKFIINLKEYTDFCHSVGKKHYTYEEIDGFATELLELPVKFLEDNEKIKVNAVPFPAIVIDEDTNECTFTLTNEFLKHWAPELSAHSNEKKEQHLLSLMESFKFNGYQNQLYRLINGYMQTMSSEYPVPIRLLKIRMGVKEGTSNWDNGRFIARILKPSCEAINEKSDIRFSYHVQKNGVRIKNIVFCDFFRIRDFHKHLEIQNAEIIEGTFREIEEESQESIENNTSNKKTSEMELTKSEQALAEFVHLSSIHGLSINESYEMYNLYQADFETYSKKMMLFNSMVNAGLMNEESKMKFLRNIDIK